MNQKKNPKINYRYKCKQNNKTLEENLEEYFI